jgi:hypothetical protein
LGFARIALGILGLIMIPFWRKAASSPNPKRAKRTTIIGVPLPFRASDIFYYRFTAIATVAFFALGVVFLLS